MRSAGAALHAKIIVVDDRIALITSANLTSRAMETNLECGIPICGGPRLALSASTLQDSKHAGTCDDDQFHRSPRVRTVVTGTKDHLGLLTWTVQVAAKACGGLRWAVEDCQHLSRRLERACSPWTSPSSGCCRD